MQQANAYLDRKADENIASEGSKSYGRASGWGMFSMPLTEFIGGSLRKPLTMLLIAVGMVLLIACANIAGLQMARASARERDLAIRVALGAQRVRLLRQALVESIVLTVAGVVLGFVVAMTTAPLLLRYLPDMLGTQIHPSFRGPVLLFVTAIAVLCSLLCGLVPAWQRTQPGWFNALQEGGRSGTGSLVHQRARSSLVVAQIALSLLLLTGAGLLLTSLKALEQVETGFQPSGLLSARFSLPQSIYGVVQPASSASAVKDEAAKEAAAKEAAAVQAASDAKVAAFFGALQDRLHSIPGVSSAALADSVPFDNQGGSSSFHIKGASLPPERSRTARQHPRGLAGLLLHPARAAGNGTGFRSAGSPGDRAGRRHRHRAGPPVLAGTRIPLASTLVSTRKGPVVHDCRPGDARSRVVAGVGHQRGLLLSRCCTGAAVVNRDRGAQLAFARGLEGRSGGSRARGGFQRSDLRREDHGRAGGRFARRPPLRGAAADHVRRTGTAAGSARTVRRHQLLGADAHARTGRAHGVWAHNVAR